VHERRQLSWNDGHGAGAEANWLAAAGNRLTGLARLVGHAGARSAEALQVLTVAGQPTRGVGLLRARLRGAGLGLGLGVFIIDRAIELVLHLLLLLLEPALLDLELLALGLDLRLLRAPLPVAHREDTWDLLEEDSEVGVLGCDDFHHSLELPVRDIYPDGLHCPVLALDIVDDGAENGAGVQPLAQVLVELLHSANG